ncbi:VENN motif pre-toxin domain-containing protein [Pseudodesulfovibrio sp. zrk46]|uniref:VENN motif pre-toxin domain-containing protein n=1 Tax=Pseudodesulfovibrio sp. zrk46 TaxID=2725288 RepID=UPI001448C2D6|nr:VENN motif pre-toxin domain-containing protein [Pseudodesulfovibrio sp. zrk46]QJB56880.1 hypothetical protein HFN16_10905 [Pseudodesulfovibrio sp. zrk46]
MGDTAAGEIAEAYKKTGDLNYVTHKIAHAVLGGAIAAANGDDIASGAVGGAVGEVVGEEYLAFRLTSGISKEDIDSLHQQGVDLAKLAGGLTAALSGMDVDTAAGTAENAAANNALDTIWDALNVLYDSGKIAYGYYIDDDGLVKEGYIDLGLDSAALLVPFAPAGITKVVKWGDDVVDVVKKADDVVEKPNLLIDVLRKSEKIVDKKGKIRFETKLDDGSKVVFRKDFGEHAHSLTGKDGPKVDHFNVEIQIPNSKGGYSKPKVNKHIYFEDGKPIIK